MNGPLKKCSYTFDCFDDRMDEFITRISHPLQLFHSDILSIENSKKVFNKHSDCLRKRDTFTAVLPITKVLWNDTFRMTILDLEITTVLYVITSCTKSPFCVTHGGVVLLSVENACWLHRRLSSCSLVPLIPQWWMSHCVPVCRGESVHGQKPWVDG